MYHIATIGAGVAKQLVVVILAIWFIVIWADKVGIVHERLFTVIADKMLNMPGLKIHLAQAGKHLAELSAL